MEFLHSIDDLIAFDKEHIWHPYTSMTHPIPAYLVEKAQGATITLHDGTELIEGMSSWWCMIHGYNHPVLNEALQSQVGKMSHVMFGGLTHLPAITLAQHLIEMTPKGLEKVFFSDSGSVAVEVALKMAIQYWVALDQPKTKFLSFRKGYHGDTFMAMSVSDPGTGMHDSFAGAITPQIFAPAPGCLFHQEWDESCLDEVINIFNNEAHLIAAVIIEPIVQGAGGMRFYHPRFLARLRELCDESGILLICDEIATGFGRTGQLFGVNHAQISPDIMCLGKALTGGYMSFAATMTTTKIAETISSGPNGVFMHGPTYMANPLACAVANASISLLLASDWQKQVLRIETTLKNCLQKFSELNVVNDVRVLGAIGVLEMKERVDVPALQKLLIEKGVWLRPFGKLIYIMPPFIISDLQLRKIADALWDILSSNK